MSVWDYGDPGRRARMRHELIGSVRGLAAEAKAAGIECLLWELMPVARELPHTVEEAEALLPEVNDGAGTPVRLCLDLGHCCAADAPSTCDPHDWLERLLPWTAAVHLQQTDGRGDHHWPFTREFDGVGIVDPARVVAIARRSPLERLALFLEVCHPHETPDQRVLDDLKESVDTWVRAGARVR
jgi:hypothetical protein